MSLELYDRMFAVNTRATWLLAKHAVPLLAAARGAIVATASISAREPTPQIGNYSANKAALVMLIRQLADELGPLGIRCNCVSPGTTRTGINDFLLSDTKVREAREALLPLRRIGQPEDLAAAIAFLAGKDASYITGVDLLVDGGLNTTLMPALANAARR
jgi:NAD(P)-dependent dehydrogenase (short-subunit alcohol dehydrogenase family)